MTSRRTAVLSGWAPLHVMLALMAGCAADVGLEGDPDFDSVAPIEQAIRNGTVESSDGHVRLCTVGVGTATGWCSGTIIGRRHVLTAAHCNVNAAPGDQVWFYGGAARTGVTRNVIRVYMPWGVTTSPDLNNKRDTNNKWADFAVLQLDSPIPAGYLPAALPTSWPGNNVSMLQVGTGRHDGQANTTRQMRYRTTLSYSASNAEGHVLTEAVADLGDSGGPLNTYLYGPQQIVHGVLTGHTWEWAYRGWYTSTAFHFDRIIRAMGHVEQYHWDYPDGPNYDVRSTDLRSCLATCMSQVQCAAYTWASDTCWLKSTTGGAGRSALGLISGRKLTTGSCTTNGSDNICRL